MPELPDVEVYLNYFEEHALHKEIKNVEVLNSGTLHHTDEDELKDLLVNDSFESVERYGKWLIITTKKDKCITMHFGMTGYLDFSDEDKKPDSTRVIFEFKGDKKLFYVDQRKFGKIEVIKNKDELIEDHSLGTDALDMDWEDFKGVFKDRRGMVKPLLMNQEAIAGIGNIYADEILFQTGIHPKTKVPDLSEKQIKSIYKKMNEVLKSAIKHDADPDEFPNDYMTPNRKKGKSWDACDGEVETVKVSGRTSYFCPHVQSKS